MPKNKTIIIATHIPTERGGSFFSSIKTRGFIPKIVELHAGDSIPHPDDYAALIIMGGLESVNNINPSTGMQNGLYGIEQALVAKKPFLGVCLGLQMLIKVAGGDVVQADRQEIGFRLSYKVLSDTFHSFKLTTAGKNDALFKNFSEIITPIFQLHEATVDLKENMKYPVTVLAKNADGIVPNQIIKIGNNAYGIQSHWEVTPELLALWITTYSALWNFDADLIRQDFNTFQKTYDETSKKLFSNWLDIIAD